VDGLRKEIVSGFYRPGDVVPSYRDLSSMLGVSQIVTKAALRQLAEEGFIVSRPRIGSVVRDCMEKRWLGHVVFLSEVGEENYAQMVLSDVLLDRLTAAGYLMTQVSLPQTSPGQYDFSRLDVALAQSVDLIVTVFARQPVLARLARQKIPYAVFSEHAKIPPSTVGGTWLDLNLAMSDFATACAAEGVKEVLQFYFWPSMGDATEALRKVGVRVRKVLVKVDESGGAMIGARRAGMETFAKLIAKGRLPHGTVCFINDDYLASGALTAISYAGLKVPEDIRLVTLANKRLGPVYPRELSRMEFDARHAGEVLSDAVLEYLKTGVYPPSSVVGPVWVEGETMLSSARAQVVRGKFVSKPKEGQRK
jgi:DNA-binding transcriptional regulator YhcF (GntR family)